MRDGLAMLVRSLATTAQQAPTHPESTFVLRNHDIVTTFTASDQVFLTKDERPIRSAMTALTLPETSAPGKREGENVPGPCPYGSTD